MRELMGAVVVGLAILFTVALVAQSDEPVSAKFAADATEQLTHLRPHMSSDMHLVAGGRFAGPAVTLRLVQDDHASSSAAGLAAVAVLEAAPAGSVVVAVLEGDKSFAVFGATFATLAKARGLAGFVVDGAVRDIQEVKRLGLATVARGTVAGSAGGHYRVDGTNVPVACDGLAIAPGDYLVADEDGVAVVPQSRRQEILAQAETLRREERALLPLIARYGSYAKAVGELRKVSY